MSLQAKVIDILQECRAHLQECTLIPLDVDTYRDDIINDYNVAAELRKELKGLEERYMKLGQECIAVKDLPNKMRYSSAVKERAVVKNMMREISKEISRALKTNEMVVKNHKRVKIEIEIVDDILARTMKELTESGDVSTLRSSTKNHVSPAIAREKSLAELKAVVQSLEELRETLQREHNEHRYLVENLKLDIKGTKTDMEDIENGRYAPAVEFASRISERRASEINQLDSKRKDIEDEIGR